MRNSFVREIKEKRYHQPWTLPVDYSIITDAVSDDFVETVQHISIKDRDRVIVCIDHDTPNSSIAIGAKQRKLIDWGVQNNLLLETCCGVGYLRVMETYGNMNQVIVGTGEHMAGFGAVGILGLTVTEAELADVLRDQHITLSRPELFVIELSGTPASRTMMQDVALWLLARLKSFDVKGKLVVFTGVGIGDLSRSQRFDLCHLTQQAGAMSAVFSDGEAGLEGHIRLSLSDIPAMVALPGAVHQAQLLSDIEPVKVDEVFIGGCRGGKLEDLRIAASILREQKVAYRTRLIIAPATSDIYLQAAKEGLLEIFLDCGAIVMNQGCSVCWGKAQGILDDGEVLVSTGSYNFDGCSGSKTASVYLSSPAVAAKTAIYGVLGE